MAGRSDSLWFLLFSFFVLVEREGIAKDCACRREKKNLCDGKSGAQKHKGWKAAYA
jgi:hypothetical protein